MDIAQSFVRQMYTDCTFSPLMPTFVPVCRDPKDYCLIALLQQAKPMHLLTASKDFFGVKRQTACSFAMLLNF